MTFADSRRFECNLAGGCDWRGRFYGYREGALAGSFCEHHVGELVRVGALDRVDPIEDYLDDGVPELTDDVSADCPYEALHATASACRWCREDARAPRPRQPRSR